MWPCDVGVYPSHASNFLDISPRADTGKHVSRGNTLGPYSDGSRQTRPFRHAGGRRHYWRKTNVVIQRLTQRAGLDDRERERGGNMGEWIDMEREEIKGMKEMRGGA